MKGEQVAAAAQSTKALGKALQAIPHSSLSDPYRLNPTKSGQKNKNPACFYNLGSPCVYWPRRSRTKAGLRLNSLSRFEYPRRNESWAIVPNRA